MELASLDPSIDRTTVYIDGFNLYFGLRAARLEKYRWLDVPALAAKLSQSRQLTQTKYFTARISGPDQDKQKRQTTYLEALETLCDLEIVYGKYLQNEKQCYNCGRVMHSYSEKMTDVNIAVSLFADAYTDEFETAIVVSGDSDLSPAVETVRRLFPRKKVIVGFPPKRVFAGIAPRRERIFFDQRFGDQAEPTSYHPDEAGRDNLTMPYPMDLAIVAIRISRCDSVWLMANAEG